MAYAKKLLSDGGNDNARISMERKTESKFGNNSWEKTLAHANVTHGGGNKRTKRTREEHANIDSASELAHTSDCWNAWRDRFMGTAEKEHHQGGSPSNGGWQWWQTEPNVGRVADGVAARVDRLKAIGNGQVPLCAATAWRFLSDQI
jgi:DNA (cytosine-5)-methyltransferase 1